MLKSAQGYSEGCVLNYEDGRSVHFIYGEEKSSVETVEPSDYIDFEEHITITKLSKADVKETIEHEERKWFHSWHAQIDHKRTKQSKFRMRTYHRWYDHTHKLEEEEVEVL
jgi:hypothetical protein